MITYIESGGEAYQLNYTVNALCAYEDRFEKDIIKALSVATVGDLRAVVWAGLIDKHPEITLEDAGAIMNDYLNGGEKSFSDIIQLCVEALTNSGFFKKAGNVKNPAAKKNPKK